jgi:hypothetical protein
MKFIVRQEIIFHNLKGIGETVYISRIKYVLSFIFASTLSAYLSPTIHLFN